MNDDPTDEAGNEFYSPHSYNGWRTPDGQHKVTVITHQEFGSITTRPLEPTPSGLIHCPDGSFTWGYRGSGPASLASALLADAIGTHAGADRPAYQAFKDQFVAAMDQNEEWGLSGSVIRQWWHRYRNALPAVDAT